MLSTMVKATVRDMTTLVIYTTAISCHSISSKHLKKAVIKSGNWETISDHLGVHTAACTAKMAVLINLRHMAPSAC